MNRVVPLFSVCIKQLNYTFSTYHIVNVIDYVEAMEQVNVSQQDEYKWDAILVDIHCAVVVNTRSHLQAIVNNTTVKYLDYNKLIDDDVKVQYL